MKKAIIVHRWDGDPNADWYPWLKKELESRSYTVNVPTMPNPDAPKIDEWVGHLKNNVKGIDKDTILIGHSVGCQTVLRCLEEVGEVVDRVLMVAPWLHLENLEDKESEDTARPWLNTPIVWNKIKVKANKFYAWFSDNDPWVPISDAKLFKEKLGVEVHIEKKMGHFTEEDGVIDLPQLLKVL